jgi:phage repressor protein C with HTH and peptisase S24 domain
MGKMNFSDRLKLAMDEGGFTQGSLAEAVGMAQPSIWKLVSGGAKASKKTIQIANVLGVRPEWLSDGDGPMRIGDASHSAPLLVREKSEQYRIEDGFRIELLDVAVSAGPGAVNTNEFIEVVRTITYTPEEARMMFGNRSEEQIRMINVKGDSMSGTIEPGDLIFVDISVRSFDGDGIYAFLYDDTAHVKRLQKMKDYLLVLSDSSRYQTWDPITRDEMNRVFIYGKVIGSVPQTYRRHG